MVKLTFAPRSGCPINFGLEIFGDTWSLLILRDILMAGKRSFGEFQSSDEAISSNILAERLKRLETCGIIESKRDAEDKRKIYYEPTKAGLALIPVLVEMAYWGAVHDAATSAPKSFVKSYRKDRDSLIAFLKSGGDPTK